MFFEFFYWILVWFLYGLFWVWLLWSVWRRWFCCWYILLYSVLFLYWWVMRNLRWECFGFVLLLCSNFCWIGLVWWVLLGCVMCCLLVVGIWCVVCWYSWWRVEGWILLCCWIWRIVLLFVCNVFCWMCECLNLYLL